LTCREPFGPELKAEGLSSSLSLRAEGKAEGPPSRTTGERFIGNSVPRIDARAALETYRRLAQATEEELVRSAHTPTRGGLGVALAQVAFSGEVGMEVDLRQAPHEGIERDDSLLFAESGSRFVVTVAPENRRRFEEIMKGTALGLVGRVHPRPPGENPRLRLVGLGGDVVVDADVLHLKQAWKETLAEAGGQEPFLRAPVPLSE
jgi:phosphoribosylformylglycinamidine synthase